MDWALRSGRDESRPYIGHDATLCCDFRCRAQLIAPSGPDWGVPGT